MTDQPLTWEADGQTYTIQASANLGGKDVYIVHSVPTPAPEADTGAEIEAG